MVGTTDSVIHILDQTGQQHPIYVHRIKAIKLLWLNEGWGGRNTRLYNQYVHSMTDSIIIVSGIKKLGPLKDPSKRAPNSQFDFQNVGNDQLIEVRRFNAGKTIATPPVVLAEIFIIGAIGFGFR